MEELARAGRSAREYRCDLKEFVGRVAAQLHRDGMVWEKVGQALGMQPMTAYRWARPYV